VQDYEPDFKEINNEEIYIFILVLAVYSCKKKEDTKTVTEPSKSVPMTDTIIYSSKVLNHI
jgi:hypothetical protein